MDILFILFFMSIDIEYDNKINFVLNVYIYAYCFKTELLTFLKLSKGFPTFLHNVGLKWGVKILMGQGVWQITIFYMCYTCIYIDNSILC